MKNKIHSRIHGALAGCWIGDAFGAPFEMMSEEILEQYITDNGMPSGYVISENRRKESKRLEVGEATDDWALTGGVANSLIRRKCFDVVDQAVEHIFIFETNPFGMGGTTKSGLGEIKEYFSTHGLNGRSPLDKANNKGCGNGIAMKVSPLAIKNLLANSNKKTSSIFDDTSISHEILKLGFLTHGDKRASLMAQALAVFIQNLICNDENDSPICQSKLDFFINSVKCCTFKMGLSYDEENSCLEKLKLATDNHNINKLDIKDLAKLIGSSSFAIESVPLAICLFLRNPKNMDKILEEAIMALGDVDTIASMACVLFGAYNGIEKIDDKYLYFNEFTIANFKNSTKIADDLIGTFTPKYKEI